MRRTAAWKPIAGVAAATIAIAGFGVAPATAAPDDPEQALARVLGSNLIEAGLLDAASAYTGTSEAANPVANPLTVDSELLGASVGVAPGLELPLIDDGTQDGLVSLGQAGTLSSYAATTAGSSVAASGVLAADGAIAVDEAQAPGTPPAATVNLTQALDRLGVGSITDEIVEELRLEVGAFAARAETDGTVVVDDYALAGLTLEFDSPAVAGLSTALTADLETVTTELNAAVEGLGGAGGTIEQVVDLLDIDVSLLGIGLLGLDATGGTATVELADLSEVVDDLIDDVPATDDVELVSADGVTINLTQGTVSLDLETLAGGLDDLDPNTPVLDAELLTRVTTAVTTLLGGITGNLSTALETAIDDSEITLAIPVRLTLLGASAATAQVNVVGTLGGFLDGVGDVTVTNTTLLNLPLTPVETVTNAILAAVTGPVLGAVGGLVDDLVLDATGGVTDAVSDLGTAAGVLVGSLGGVFDVLDEVATLTVNAQPTAATPAEASELGEDGFTVHALEVVLLPALVGSPLASVTLGSASVLNVDAAATGTLVIDPDQARAGETVALSGTGWDAEGGDVTVTFTDADTGTQVGQPVVITPGADGSITGSFTVPTGTEVGALTGTATQGDDSTDATLTVVAAPVVIVEPDPADPGETITISGSGYLCGPVTVTISDGATVLETIADIPVGTDGTWSTTFTVPADVAANSLTISAVATGECGDEDDTDVEIDQPESLALTPDRVRGGDAVAIAGDGWAAGSDVTVTFTDAAGAVVGEPVVITPDADGSIDGSFTVPAGTAAGVLTGTAAQGDDSSTDTVTVFVEPTVVVEPDPVDPGDTITISGSGFLCGPVDVTIADGTTVLETIEGIEVAADGTWSTTYAVPADVDATSLTITAVATGECGDEGETDVEVDQPETIAFTPGEVRGGDEIAIEGDGWDADGGPVTVVFEDAEGNPVGEPVEIVPGDDGTIDGVFEVPAGTPAGELTGTATQGDDETTDVVEVFDPASVSIEPGTVRAGDDVTIGGGGWLPSGGDVTVTFEDADGTPIGEPVVLTPAADGTIAGDFTVPEGTEAGIVTATAVQGDDEAADTLVIAEEPSVTVQPDTARPGDVVTVGGAGWTDGTPVTVTFTDAEGEQVGDELTLDPVDGVITGTFTVPADVEPGTLTATATQGGDEATDELEVTLAPTVSATPEQLHAGDAITVGGTGWDPASVVTVTVTDADGATVGTPLSLTPSPEGVITGSATVPEGTEPGALTVTAVQGDDEATDAVELVADPTVVVEPDPAAPGQQVTISGDGFLCGPVTVTISAGDSVLATIADLTVVDGQWSTVYTVPADIAVDSLLISAVATGDCGDEGETDLEVDLVETLSATPGFAQRGQVVTLTGTGWSDGAVTITATDAADSLLATFPAISVGGAFTSQFTVPQGAALGTLEFVATQGDDVETDTVSVVSIPAGPASLIVAPSAVEPGDSVALDGDGWDPTQGLVTVTFRTPGGATVGSVPVAVREDGRLITGTFTVPPSAAAPQTLTATAVQGTRTASDTLQLRQADLPVIRLGGPERFSTAVEISRDAFPFGADVVYIANAVNFPDALSAAPAAAQQDAPLLVTRREYLEPVVIEELERLEPERIVIVGDVNSVSANVEQQAAGLSGEVVRLGGADRFETSRLIAEYAFQGAAEAYVATGFNFPDALTAGAAAGSVGAPMLLTHGATPPAALIETLRDLGVTDVHIAGDAFSVAATQDAAFEAAGFRTDRYAGEDRYDTGVLVAQDNFGGPVDRIYVAQGVRFPDALAGSAVAGAQRVPVYLSPTTCLWDDVLDEIDRLGDPQVVLLGDELALDANVFALRPCNL
ncbi:MULTISPECIES: choice-of-anchor G family protein [unclassified Agrococcus]|uniref:choice-of-anchor G family protein n=1 Tax=unclassified Agrococcus TaxID=2615065 RepID=UPI003607107E